MEARVFKWFGYVSLRPHDVAQWATSLLIHYVQYILNDYNVLWGVLFIHRTTNTTLLSNLYGIP